MAATVGGCAGNHVEPFEDELQQDAGTEVIVRTLDASSGEFADFTGEIIEDAGVTSDASVIGAVEVLDAGKASAPVALVPIVDAGNAKDASVAPQACDLAGKWAVSLRATVSSTPTQFTTSGGEARAWLLLDVTGENGSFKASTRVCGVNFPLIKLNAEFGAENYQIQFPRSTSTKFTDGLPGGTMTLRSTPSSVELDAFAVLLGVELDHVAKDVWPADATSIAHDADSDSKPGVTVTWSTSDGNLLPPIDLNKASRARDTQLAARLVIEASKFSTCEAWTGPTGATKVDTHVLACTRSDGTACTTDQSGVLQIIRPQYTAKQSTLEAARLPATARCTDVLTKLD